MTTLKMAARNCLPRYQDGLRYNAKLREIIPIQKLKLCEIILDLEIYCRKSSHAFTSKFGMCLREYYSG